MFFLELVVRCPWRRIAPAPELLNELIPLVVAP
jgi:hypothetical protein